MTSHAVRLWISTAVVCGLTLASATPAAAQQRTLYVSVVDRNGEPVSGLGADVFSLKENGKQRQVVSAAPATEPVDIVVLFDDSGSTTDTLRFQRDALTRFVTAMAPKARISIVALAERPRTMVNYTNNPELLAQGVGKLFTQSGASMALMDAAIGTSEGLAQRGGPRRIVLAIVTDGPEQTSKIYRTALAAMRGADVQFHSILVGRFQVSAGAGAAQMTAERTLLLDEGPRDTGGQRVAVVNASGLPVELERLARELSGQYKVVYTSADPLKKDRSDKIEITSSQKDLRMRGTLVRGPQ